MGFNFNLVPVTVDSLYGESGKNFIEVIGRVESEIFSWVIA